MDGLRFDHVTRRPHPVPVDRLIEGRGTDEQVWSDCPGLHTAPRLDLAAWVDRHPRIWIVSPHPDDEVLALGACMAQLSAQGADLRIVSVTDGTASHPGSERWPEQRLADVRPRELRQALSTLGIDAIITRVGLPDGGVTAQRDALTAFLVAHVGTRDLILVTAPFDGHPDHEAAAAAAALAARITGASIATYPVWMWHWARPVDGTIPWRRARRVVLDSAQRAGKREAIGQFISQIEPDGERDAILPPHVVERFVRPFEIVFV